MTILVAVKDLKLGGIHILSDSLATDNYEKYDIGCKWTEFTDFYLWITGQAIAINIVRDYLSEQINAIKITWNKEIIDIYKLIETTLKTDIQYKISENDTRDNVDFDISIVTKDGRIFSCSQFLFVIEHKEFLVAGSGSSYMKWAIAMIYNLTDISKEVLIQAMEIPYLYSISCGAPTNYIYLPITTNE